MSGKISVDASFFKESNEIIKIYKFETRIERYKESSGTCGLTGVRDLRWISTRLLSQSIVYEIEYQKILFVHKKVYRTADEKSKSNPHSSTTSQKTKQHDQYQQENTFKTYTLNLPVL